MHRQLWQHLPSLNVATGATGSRRYPNNTTVHIRYHGWEYKYIFHNDACQLLHENKFPSHLSRFQWYCHSDEETVSQPSMPVFSFLIEKHIYIPGSPLNEFSFEYKPNGMAIEQVQT